MVPGDTPRQDGDHERISIAAMWSEPPVLSRRGGPVPAPTSVQTLSLSAEARSRVRGRRTTDQGLEVLLCLPRTGPLQPGEQLSCDQHQLLVEVVAAQESLLAVEAVTPLALLQAAYHLGNRHLPMEIQAQRLLIPRDGVLQQMLEQRGLTVYGIHQVFCPEPGAYGSAPHHSHGVNP